MKYSLFLLIAFISFSCNEKIDKKQNNLKSNTTSFQLSNQFKIEADTTVCFLWQEKVWDEDLKDTLQKIRINNMYAQTASPEAKIVLAYISILAGSECWWKGEQPNADYSNLQCAILSALSMGFQCSDEHLQPLRKAFAHDSIALEKIQECAAIPYTATYQNAITNITIQKKGNQYIVNFNAVFINARKQTGKEWRSLMIFTVSELGIEITKNITFTNN